MGAERGVAIGQAYSEATIAADGAPIPASANVVLISTDSKESGLWLWQGEAPSQPSPPRPKSRAQQILRRIIPAAGWGGWITLPAGSVLILIVVSMMPRPDRSVSADAPAVALSSASSSTIAHPIVAVPPAKSTVALSSAPLPAVAGPIAAVPSAKPTEAQLDQVRVPSSPADKIKAREPEPRMTSWRAPKSSQTSRKIHASHVRRGPVPMPGVLTPPPMTWHGGGY